MVVKTKPAPTPEIGKAIEAGIVAEVPSHKPWTPDPSDPNDSIKEAAYYRDLVGGDEEE